MSYSWFAWDRTASFSVKDSGRLSRAKGTLELASPYKKTNENSQFPLDTQTLVLANPRAIGPWSFAGTPEVRRMEWALQCLLWSPVTSVATKGGWPQGAALLVGGSGLGSYGDNRGRHTPPAFQIRDSPG